MANKFKLWVEDENINATQTYNDFDSDTQRAGGFVGGTPASAIRVNTALRQANLIACALMDVVAADNSTVDFRSSRADIAQAISSGLAALTPDKAEKIGYSTSNTTNSDNTSLKVVVLNEIPATFNANVLYLIEL